MASNVVELPKLPEGQESYAGIQKAEFVVSKLLDSIGEKKSNPKQQMILNH